MIATINAEWIKIRTVVVHWVLVTIAVAFPMVITGLGAGFGDWTSFDLSNDISSLVVGLSVVTAMVLGAMTATSLTSEYSHSTIRPTFAATPSRVRVHLAKLIVTTWTVLGVAAIAVFGSWFLAQLILSARGDSISLGDSGVFTKLISVIVLAVLVSWFGYGLGLLIRNAPATITILLLWPLIIENLIALLLNVVGWEGATKWLPYAAAIQATVDEEGVDALGRPEGFIWFGVVAAVLVALGLLAEQRRDA